MYIGTIEAGGTKFVLGILNEKLEVINRMEIKTEHPTITFENCINYFKQFDIEALGIGCFGPVDLNKNSETYGYILNTPKPNWGNVDVLGFFKEHLNIPVAIDTDVNGAAIAELTHGAGKGYKDIVYLTVGTGIGGGIITDGKIVHGKLHPEVGHMMLAKLEGDTFEGVCKYHSNCAESLVCGPALEKRTGLSGKDIDSDHEVWDTVAKYLAQLISNLVLTTSPQKVVMGGGVMHNEFLYPLINKYVKEIINNYVEVEDDLVVHTTLNDNAGIYGAYQIAYDELNK